MRSHCFALAASIATGNSTSNRTSAAYTPASGPSFQNSPTQKSIPALCSNIGMLQVVAAIIEREGRILICRRKADQSHPLQWEFPGGKVEHGETLPEALARELQEELDLGGVTGEEITRYEYTYPGKHPIRLVFFRVTGFQGEPRNVIFEDMRWEPRHRLAGFDFVAGDMEFLRGISSGLY
jgi:8-oxo-dGTP diphosphatase